MKYNRKATPDQDHLLVLYSRWMDNKKQYGGQMAEAIDRIITTVLAKHPVPPFYRRTEDKADLLGELRLLCLQRLERIENPTNKRIYNYLRVSIELYLKDKSRKVGRQIDREDVENDFLGEKTKYPSLGFCFGDPTAEQVANMLAHGETKQSIRERLDLSRTELEDVIENIKETLLTC